MENSQKIYMQLEERIEQAKKQNKPIDTFVKQQIELLEKTHNEFVLKALSNNNDLEYSLDFAEIRIKQLQAISFLCKKIGLSTEKYDNMIREIRVKHLGKDFVDEYYK